MKHEAMKIALAYVGVIVGAGLSSGQDILQYFLSFGKVGMIGVIILGILNIVFGRIIIALGSYFQANNHQEVLGQITRPILNRIIDWTLIISNFIIGFVMIAGAGANLKQQFGLPAYLGALICSLLIIIVSFMDFEKITSILGIFTPLIIAIIVIVTIYTFVGKSYDFQHLDQVAQTMTPALPNVWLSVINYFSLCTLTGVSMAFVLGGSVIRIGVAEKAGMIGGALVGSVILCASSTLFANIDRVKNAEIPMLEIVKNIHPVLSVIYAIIIFALIFNTAFSLFYATARRFSGGIQSRQRKVMIVVVGAGYLCSFGGFKTLISKMYPILGYLGIVLLLVLLITWIKGYRQIIQEKYLRRKLIRLHLKKHNDDVEFTKKDQKTFDRLSDASIAETETLKKDIKQYAHDIIESDTDEKDFIKNELSLPKDASKEQSHEER